MPPQWLIPVNLFRLSSKVHYVFTLTVQDVLKEGLIEWMQKNLDSIHTEAKSQWTFRESINLQGILHRLISTYTANVFLLKIQIIVFGKIKK